MPFFYDETNIDYPEDGSQPPPPRADQFVYMTSAEYGGPIAPVRFLIPPPAAIVDEAPPAPSASARRSILDVLLGRARPAERESQDRLQESRRQQQLKREHQTQRLFSVLISALRDFGVRRAYCRYDGGNDEGFSWLDHFERNGGERIDTGALLAQLFATGVLDKLHEGGFMEHLRGAPAEKRMAGLKEFVLIWLVDEWASILFGGGFGAGEYSMYGAFTVDLDECTITDDPHADPVVENIRIAT